ncbi:MAG: hypothetical protein WBF40_12925, partial [Methyloceanibacter sp.]
MRISISTALLIASIGLGAGAASAASGSYICAVGEVYECEAVTGCKRVSADAINLSEFIVIDVDKKQLSETAIGEDGQTEDV